MKGLIAEFDFYAQFNMQKQKNLKGEGTKID